MSDDAALPARTTLADLDPVQALEAVFLLAQRLSRDLAGAPALTARSLTPDGYAVLVNTAAEAGSPIARIGRRAVAASADLQGTRQALIADGLIVEQPGASGRQLSYALTAAGAETLAAIRAELAERLAGLPEKSWRPLSRTAILLRTVGDNLGAPRGRQPRKPT